MNFVAIDFETANEKRNSPCSLGLTVVKDSQIILEKYWLIRPKELRFAPMNVWIHGIREGDVSCEKEFHTLWPEILPYLENNLVVAHNASFDMSVLRSTLDLYDLPYPTFDYCCTMVMSKHFYAYLDNAKLNTVSHHLGHQFTHHHASADATACAHILLAISKELGTTHIQDISRLVGFKLGKVFERGYTPSGTNGGGLVSTRQGAHSPNQYKGPSPTTDFFHNKVVAFTGPLSSMSRMEAIAIVEQLGGTYSSSVTRRTNLVITGIKDPYSLSPNQMSTKLRRAMELIDKGQPITFLSEQDFLNL